MKLRISLACLALSACSTMPSMGGGKGGDSSAAGGANAQSASSQLTHCDASLGTLAIDEDRSEPWYYQVSQRQLGSTVPLLRLMVQQSNCFVLVERGNSLNNVMTERGLAASGELRSNSSMGKGQMVAADYTMSPSINFSENTGGGMASVASYIPGASLLAGLAGGLSSNSASTTLLLIDNRSGVQLSAAQGSARNWDIAGAGRMFSSLGSGSGSAGGSAYSSTPEGKIITAAFMDSFNQMVAALQNYKAQTVSGGLGTGGKLGVSGGTTAASPR